MSLKLVSNFPDRLKEALNGMSLTDLATKIGMSKQSLSAYSLGVRSPKAPTVKAISEELNVNPVWLMGYDAQKFITRIPADAITNIEFYQVPILGEVRAGTGGIAVQEIIGYQTINKAMIKNAEECFGLYVKGDSMSPKLEEGDLVIVRQMSSIDSGDIGVVIVDGEEGVIKKVIYDEDHIELHSFNPYYPARIFRDEEVLRVSVVGKAINSMRIL